MKKTVLFLLIGIMLAMSAAAGADGGKWQVVAGDAASFVLWTACPLDAHNAVVTTWSINGKPWHVSWYRDGELFRDLTWIIEEPYMEHHVIAQPVAWDGEHLTVRYSTRKGAYQEVVDESGMHSADPGNYETYLAEWTENGLENAVSIPEDWYDTNELGRIAFSQKQDGFGLQIDGKDVPLPEGFPGAPVDDVFYLKCYPVSDSMYLLTYMIREDENRRVICMDHGTKRSEVRLTEEEDWTVWPEANGGFFARIGWPTGSYDPVRLKHFNADGEQDRTMELKGEKVVVHPAHTWIDESTGNTVLYGTAVANSRLRYAAFAMTLDRDLNVADLDVRELSAVYRDYSPGMYLAPDGSAWVMIGDLEGKKKTRPMMIPFSELKRSGEDFGLTLE